MIWKRRAALVLLVTLAAAGGTEAALRITGFEGVALYETSPDGFYRMRPGTVFLDGGRTNPLGLRGPLPDRPEIIMTGDSVVFGTGLALADTVPARLAALTGRNVLNAGVPGYGAREPAGLVRYLGTSIPPALYIHVITVNDITEASRTPLPPPFWLDTRKRHNPVRIYEFSVLLSHYVQVALTRFQGGESGRWANRISDPKAAIIWVTEKIRELSAELPEGSRFLVLTAPYRTSAALNDTWIRNYESVGGRAALLAALLDAGLPAARPESVYMDPDFSDDVHFSPSGAARFAKDIRDTLEKAWKPAQQR